MAKFKDFSRDAELETVEVAMDGDTFHFAGAAPTMAILDMAKVNKAADSEKLMILMEFLDAVMLPDDAERFAGRLRSAANPITIAQVTDLVVWLIEEVYTQARPTQGASPLPNGSATTGTSSTGGAAPTGSTPGLSPLAAP